MSRGVARKGDRVLSQFGYGGSCAEPLNVKVDQCNSSNVYADGKLIVCYGNLVEPHNEPGCSTTDQSTLSSASTTVFINGKGVGRIDDLYETPFTSNQIKEGSSTVFSA